MPIWLPIFLPVYNRSPKSPTSSQNHGDGVANARSAPGFSDV